jgi:hypothetical protein
MSSGGNTGSANAFLPLCPSVLTACCCNSEISLSDYPDKRTDMLQLSDRLTVPQIFFNTLHVGGASDLAQLLEEGTLATLYAEMLAAPTPDDARLALPSYPPKEEQHAAPLTEESICIGTECWSYAALAKMLETDLDIRDRQHHARSYRKCFVGSDAVDYLCARFPELKSRSEAVQVGRSLMDSGLFHHVTYDHIFKDEKLFYRLQTQSKPKALNTWRKWADRVDDPMLTLKMCRKAFSALQNAHMDPQGCVNYEALAEDDLFAAFEESTCEFQLVDVGAMPDNYKQAFFINLYNLVVLHAFTAVGIPSSNLRRLSFFDSVGYVIGGSFFSLSDIENGILRANHTPPFHLRRPFASSDPRHRLALKEADCRIHFALNCGAKSCPPIKEFTAAAVDEELRIAAMAFFDMDDNLEIGPGWLRVSKILSWYRKDFGGSDAAVVQAVAGWLRGERQERVRAMLEGGAVKIKYLDYDWSTNASKAKVYDPGALKRNPSSCSVS